MYIIGYLGKGGKERFAAERGVWVAHLLKGRQTLVTYAGGWVALGEKKPLTLLCSIRCKVRVIAKVEGRGW